METLLAKAIYMASEAFIHKKDKGGKPYILHCLWVMNKVRHLGTRFMIVAVLHDLIEDTEYKIEDLSPEFPKDIIIAIDILTHKEGDSYEDYIRMISHNELAKEVKLRDLEHNSKLNRLKGVREKDFQRVIKYNKSYNYLLNN